jgi:hypothetical protein
MGQKIYTSTSFEVLSTIHEVETELTKPVTRRAFGKLFSKLEIAQESCQNQDLLEKIISLYGQIVDRYVDTKVQAIASLAERSPRNLKKIQEEIADVKLYGLSQQNFAIIEKIEQKIQKSLPITVGSYEDTEFSEDLFMLASHIYHKERKKGRALYHTLPLSTQRCVSKHLSRLHTLPFHNDALMLQALFAAAYELANRPLRKYPSHEEIHQFFLEEQAIVKGDTSPHWVRYKTN